MTVRVLGCSGGIGGNRHTTSFLVDHDILFDAGTGLTKLPLDELAGIDHVFITHSHMDHIATLPMLVDSVSPLRNAPIKVYGLPDTLRALKLHVFNWLIWPDFSELPTPHNPMLVFESVEVGQKIDVGNGRTIQALPANHQVPACGYAIHRADETLAFTGDTAECPALWPVLRGFANLNTLIIEAAFADHDEDLARRAGHFTPKRLALELMGLPEGVEVLISHLKPADAELIERQLSGFARTVRVLND